MCKVHVCHSKVFSSSGPMNHMGFCHHFAFVVIVVLWQGCHCHYIFISSIQKLTHYFSKSHWVCKVHVCHSKVFSSSGPMKHMSFLWQREGGALLLEIYVFFSESNAWSDKIRIDWRGPLLYLIRIVILVQSQNLIWLLEQIVQFIWQNYVTLFFKNCPMVWKLIK